MAIPMDQREGWIWFDGELKPWKDAKIHVLTHGLRYASCVFEGERAYGGEIFRSRERTERLIASGQTLDFTIPYSIDEIEAAKRLVLEKNNLVDAYARPVAPARLGRAVGAGAQEHRSPRHRELGVAVYFSVEEKLKGIRLEWSKWRSARAPETIPCKAKAAGLYMICTLSKDAAMANGYADALMLDYRGYVAEATGANVMFFIKGGDEIHTPDPTASSMASRVRPSSRSPRRRASRVIERRILAEELAYTDECFLPRYRSQGDAPVSVVGEYSFKPGKGCDDADHRLHRGGDAQKGRGGVSRPGFDPIQE